MAGLIVFKHNGTDILCLIATPIDLTKLPSPPKGELNLFEANYFNAAKRETIKMSGYNSAHLNIFIREEYGIRNDEKLETMRFFLAMLMVSAPQDPPGVNYNELKACKWVTLQAAKDLIEFHEMMDWAEVMIKPIGLGVGMENTFIVNSVLDTLIFISIIQIKTFIFELSFNCNHLFLF